MGQESARRSRRRRRARRAPRTASSYEGPTRARHVAAQAAATARHSPRAPAGSSSATRPARQATAVSSSARNAARPGPPGAERPVPAGPLRERPGPVGILAPAERLDPHHVERALEHGVARLQARQRIAGRERRPGEQQLEGAVLVQQQDLLAAHVPRLPARDAVAPGRVTREDEPVARELERGGARRQARQVRGDEEGHLERGREPPGQQPRAQPGAVGAGAGLRRALGGAIRDHGIDIQVGEAERAALERRPTPPIRWRGSLPR